MVRLFDEDTPKLGSELRCGNFGEAQIGVEGTVPGKVSKRSERDPRMALRSRPLGSLGDESSTEPAAPVGGNHVHLVEVSGSIDQGDYRESNGHWRLYGARDPDAPGCCRSLEEGDGVLSITRK
jgi:hypothetical protein